MNLASGVASALDEDFGRVGLVFSHRWIVEFKPPADGATAPLVSTSPRDKVCSLFGAILACRKGGLIFPAKDSSLASPLTSPSDIPTDDSFEEYFVPLQHKRSTKGIILFKSEVNFSTLRKSLWQFLRSCNCWITPTNIQTSSEIKALGWLKNCVPRFFDPLKVKSEMNKLIGQGSKLDFNSPLIDMVPTTIYGNGSSTRAVKIYAAQGIYSQALDIFVQAFKTLSMGDEKIRQECPTIQDYQFVPFQLKFGDINVDSKSVMASLIEDNNKFKPLSMKKQQARTGLQEYIMSTIPMVTSYANVVAGNKNKPSKQAKVSVDLSIAALSQKMLHLESLAEKTSLTLERIEKQLMALMSLAKLNEEQSQLDSTLVVLNPNEVATNNQELSAPTLPKTPHQPETKDTYANTTTSSNPISNDNFNLTDSLTQPEPTETKDYIDSEMLELEDLDPRVLKLEALCKKQDESLGALMTSVEKEPASKRKSTNLPDRMDATMNDVPERVMPQNNPSGLEDYIRMYVLPKCGLSVSDNKSVSCL
jgi:hypothetical protein